MGIIMSAPEPSKLKRPSVITKNAERIIRKIFLLFSTSLGAILTRYNPAAEPR